MSYNWKCCSFYPNNFDASALLGYRIFHFFLFTFPLKALAIGFFTFPFSLFP